LSLVKIRILGADAIVKAEGNMVGRVSASVWTAQRGRRTWHVQKLLGREPGDPGSDQPEQKRLGPHREGEEPYPMTHGRGKSDSAVVAGKSVNKAKQLAAEPMERRAAATVSARYRYLLKN
jgi:hypothetical protein